MPVKIKIEPLKNLDDFKEFIEKHELGFAVMSVSGCPKKNTRWVCCSSDEPTTEIIIKMFDSINYDYIMYSGEIGEKFCAAAEIKF